MSPTLIKRLSYPLSTCSNWGFSIVKIVKSGVIVFREREDKIEVLLLHRQKHNDWSFPKGHVEVGEGLLEAGLRELFEETSVQPMVMGRLAGLEYLNKKGELVSVAFFLGYTEKNDHQLKIKTAEWVPLAQVERTLSHENLRTYFKTRVKPLFSKKYFSNRRTNLGDCIGKNQERRQPAR